MSHHWHMGIEHAIWTVLVAILGINLTRFVAAQLARLDGPLGNLGVALGGTVTFGGAA